MRADELGGKAQAKYGYRHPARDATARTTPVAPGAAYQETCQETNVPPATLENEDSMTEMALNHANMALARDANYQPVWFTHQGSPIRTMTFELDLNPDAYRTECRQKDDNTCDPGPPIHTPQQNKIQHPRPAFQRFTATPQLVALAYWRVHAAGCHRYASSRGTVLTCLKKVRLYTSPHMCDQYTVPVHTSFE
jgi:hypothetical protein